MTAPSSVPQLSSCAAVRPDKFCAPRPASTTLTAEFTAGFVSGSRRSASYCCLHFQLQRAAKNFAACLFAVVVYYYYVFFGFCPYLCCQRDSRAAVGGSRGRALAALYLTLGSLMAGNRILMDFVISSKRTPRTTAKTLPFFGCALVSFRFVFIQLPSCLLLLAYFSAVYLENREFCAIDIFG